MIDDRTLQSCFIDSLDSSETNAILTQQFGRKLYLYERFFC